MGKGRRELADSKIYVPLQIKYPDIVTMLSGYLIRNVNIKRSLMRAQTNSSQLRMIKSQINLQLVNDYRVIFVLFYQH